MTITLFLFITTIQVLILAMHAAFFRSLIHFFPIAGPVFKTIFYALMGILAFSFISAFLLLRVYGSGIAVFYYRFAATWMGFLIHFLVAMAVLWSIVLVSKWTGFSANPSLNRHLNHQTIAGVVLTAAVLFSIYGIWNAFHPKVREIAVPVHHVPEHWANRRIVQLSDIHLGHMHGKVFAERLVNRVNNLDPDLIVITGDLLDGVNGAYEEVIKPINRLRARYGVFFVTGNHEHYVGIRKALNIIKKTQIRILDNEWQDIDGLELIGVSYPGIDSLADIRNLPANKPSDHARILMFHTPTTIERHAGDLAHRHTRTYWMPDTSFDLNKRLNADLQLSGHTHHGQIFPFNLISRLLFNGYDYGLKQDGDFRIYTSCGTGTWGPPMRTAGISEITLIRLVSAP
ncbi:MAG: metallophosphoesterase [Desulfosalsimonadaceae bacterium]|nr:metallophosphoesterase [Desulfosalsimonadaceae bacterium]